MEGIGGEISSKIRAAIKAKLMEMGAYVDEELPDYVMVMVANKRSKSQMADDLQLFLGKSTEQFTNWLQQVLNKLQEVATVNNKSLADTKKVQSRTLSSDETAHKAKSASKLKCEQVTKPKPEHTPDRAGSHRSEKKHAGATATGTVGGITAKKDRKSSSGGSGASTEKTKRSTDMKVSKTASSKTKIVLMNSDDDDDDEDFINIKADAEAEALLKAELPASAKQLQSVAAAVAATAEVTRKQSVPSSEAATTAERVRAEPRQVDAGAPVANVVSARDVTAALAHSTSSARKVRPTVRRVVTAPASAVTVATKRSATGEGAGGLAKRAAVCIGEDETKVLASTVAVTDRLGLRQSGGPSIKDRLGTRCTISATSAAVLPAAPSRLASRLGVRNPAVAEAGTSRLGTGSGKVTDRLGAKPTSDGAAEVSEWPGARTATAEGSGPPPRQRVMDRLGVRRSDTAREGGTSRKRSADGGGGGLPEVAAKRLAAEGPGSRLARRLRELAEGPISSSARVAQVPPNNIRQGSAITSRVDRRPLLNSQVVSTGGRGVAADSRDREGEVAPTVALPSVVRVTPRPRLPASMQANKNLLLKAVAEAQRSVAAAAAASAAASAASASSTAASANLPGASQHRGEGQHGWGQLRVGSHREEEGGEEEQEPEEEEDYVNERDEVPENPEALFTRGFLNGENFAVTVSNESGAAGDSDVAEAEEQFDDGRQRARELRGSGRRRLVVTASGESRESAKASVSADAPQQITIQLSPEGSRDGDSSSEREDEDAAEIPPQSIAAKDNVRGYDGQPVYDDEEEEEVEEEGEEEEGPVATVAAVRPTVVTTVPHMDMEPIARPNPQFVVTLDGLDASMFPGAGTDDDEGPADPGCVVDRDVSKADSGADGVGSSVSTTSTGRATIVQRVEPRLRLGPMPSHSQQQLQHGDGELSSAGLSSSSGIAPTKTAERCKYWPACRMGAKCAFHHPTQTCRVFPACKFGEKCLYIHPNCKFDAACTRRDCPYTHSSPRLSAAAAAAMLPVRGLAQPGSGSAVCRFFPSCTNPACRFLHPKACKYGRYCVKPGCTFQHDGVPTTDKLKWVCPFRA